MSQINVNFTTPNIDPADILYFHSLVFYSQWRPESCKVCSSWPLQLHLFNFYHIFHSRNWPHTKEGRRRRRGLREHIWEDAGLYKPDAEGETGDRLENTNKEAPAVTRPDQGLGSKQRHQRQVRPSGKPETNRNCRCLLLHVISICALPFRNPSDDLALIFMHTANGEVQGLREGNENKGIL